MKIEYINIIKKFADTKKGLDNISLTIETPAFLLFTGHNGSGKTLLIRHLFGLENADSGTILIDGQELHSVLDSSRKRMALVFQEPEHQILGISVREDAEFTPRALGKKPDEYKPLVDNALRLTGLSGYDDQLCATLSGGEKRRLAIASALVSNPDLLVLDEPFNGLDWQGASDLLHILINLYNQGLGIILVTHDIEKCLAHASRIIVMDKGKIVADSLPSEIFSKLELYGLRGANSPSLQSMTWLKH